MPQRDFQARVKSGDPLLGCFLTWPTGGVAELLALAGFDFIVIDTEHGVFSPESVASTIVAADTASLPAIVRVPSCPAVEASRYLDYGATGILFPSRANAISTSFTSAPMI